MDSPCEKSASDTNINTVGNDKTPPSFVFHRAKRSRDELEDSFSSHLEDFKAEIKKIMASQETQLKEVCQTLKEIQQSNSDIQDTLAELTLQNSELKQKVGELEYSSKEDKKYIAILEGKIDDLQIDNRKASFEIKSMPKSSDETKENLIDMVLCLSKTIDCRMERSDIKDIYRVRPKNPEKKNTPIIVETASTMLKVDLLKLGKAFNLKHKAKLCANHLGLKTQEETPVFLSEHLTAKGSRLHFLARDLAKSKDYKFCWTAYGKVYLRKTENSQCIAIKSESQIHKLLQEQ